jgi:hypothetical protein
MDPVSGVSYVVKHREWCKLCSEAYHLFYEYLWIEYSQTCIKRSFLGQLKWPYKTSDLLKKVQFIYIVLWQDKKKMTFKYRWLLNRGDHMDRFDCICCSGGLKICAYADLFLWIWKINKIKKKLLVNKNIISSGEFYKFNVVFFLFLYVQMVFYIYTHNSFC